MTTNAIEVHELRRVFGVRKHSEGLGAAMRELFSAPRDEVVAVDEVSFGVAPGERLVIVGPEGSGKTTLLKLLAGILYPSAGEVRVLGLVPWKERRSLDARMASLFPGRSRLSHQVAVRESFERVLLRFEGSPARHRERRDELVDAFDLEAAIGRPWPHLAPEQRLRAELVASLLHAPEVLFLDEPEQGLTPGERRAVRDVLSEICIREGRSLVLTTQATADLDRIGDRAIVMNRGRVMLDRPLLCPPPAVLRKRLTLRTADVRLDLELPGVRVHSRAPHRLALDVDTEVTTVNAVVAAVLRRASIRSFEVEEGAVGEVTPAEPRAERLVS